MIKVDNYAKLFDKQGKILSYRVKVFVDEPNSVLSQIKHVVYKLPSTFPARCMSQQNSEDRFSTEFSMWGKGFTIMAKITFLDGHVEDSWHFVDLTRDWPR